MAQGSAVEQLASQRRDGLQRVVVVLKEDVGCSPAVRQAAVKGIMCLAGTESLRRSSARSGSILRSATNVNTQACEVSKDVFPINYEAG